jgi:DNA-nicking Smr family endonuclease
MAHDTQTQANQDTSSWTRALSDEEKKLWDTVIETVTPLVSAPKKVRLVKSPSPLKKEESAPLSKTAPQVRNTRGQLPVTEPESKLSPHHARQITRGKEKLRTIDLHGFTRERAYQALTQYVENCQRKNHRYLLVITGKGHGIIRSSVQSWLRDGNLSSMILSFSTARPEHGGEGAFYVILRKSTS